MIRTVRFLSLKTLSTGAAVLAFLMLSHSVGFAATQTTGDIFGEVRDAATKAAVADAIVVITSPSMQGEQTAITDERGRYRVDSIPPGTYSVQVTAPSYKPFEQAEVILNVGREVKVVCQILPEVVTGEEIVVKKQITSVIDQGSTTTGLTMGRDYMDKVAQSTGKNTFNAIVEATPGAKNDDYGTSFNGASSPENGIYVDGINSTNGATGSTDPTVGIVPTQLPLEFLDQVEVKTGGYLPEYGDASGAIINVITKLGGNEFHGSVFDYLIPLQAPKTQITRAGEAIGVKRSLVANEQIGFDIGGPIVKDYLWFNVGFAPQFVMQNATRSFFRQEEDPATGGPVTDPVTLKPKVDPLSSRYNHTYGDLTAVYAYVAKFTLNVNENHRITASISGNPATRDGLTTASINGSDSSTLSKLRMDETNLSLLYDGKVLNKHLLINASLAYNRRTERVLAYNNSIQVENTNAASLSDNEPNVTECAGAAGQFSDGTSGPRCPVTNYTTGGTGFVETRTTERIVARGNLTGIFNALGTHQLKAGAEFNFAAYAHQQAYTGGDAVQITQNDDGSSVYYDFRRFGNFKDPNAENLFDPNNITYKNSVTNRVGYYNTAAYIQDQWNLLDVVNINGGVRFDFQDLHGGDITGHGIGPQIFTLSNVSPRLGVVYDFTKTGRSKLYGSWGRFFELLPLDLMERNFPTGASSQVNVARELCTNPDPSTCNSLPGSTLNGGSGTSAEQVFKGLHAPYTEQFQAGFEYQILSDLLAGISYTNSRLHDVVEDTTPDETQNIYNYAIGNPGITPEQKVGITRNGVTHEKINLSYPTPERRYDALTLYVQKTLGHNFIGNVSYVLSWLRGNYPGLVNTTTGQLDPNIQSDFDLASLLPNRYGLLPGDQTHQFKIDGTYIFQISNRFSLAPNASLRLASGNPYSYLGPHPIYGASEAYILQRGSAGRTDIEFFVNLGVNAEYAFSKDTRLSVGLYALDLTDNQYTTLIDQSFVRDNQYLRPVIGGDASDLKHLKTINQKPTKLNPNFGNALRRSDPTQLRLSAKITF